MSVLSKGHICVVGVVAKLLPGTLAILSAHRRVAGVYRSPS